MLKKGVIIMDNTAKELEAIQEVDINTKTIVILVTVHEQEM